MTRRSFFTAWDSFWFRTGPPHVLALFRIAFGLFLLFFWGLKLPHVSLLYSRAGIVIPAFDVGDFLVPSAHIAILLFSLFLLCLLLMTAGFCFRPATILSVMFTLYYWFLAGHHFLTSFDRLFLFSLVVLSISGADRTLSLAMLRKRGSFFAWEPVCILPQRLLAIQITATYVGVGWQKFMLPDWQGGEVLALGFIGRWATPLAYGVIRLNWPMPVYDAFVWCIKFFEFLLPIGLWFPRTRPWACIGGALFHIGITLLLGIWWFLVLIPAYVVYWRPEEVQLYVDHGGR